MGKNKKRISKLIWNKYERPMIIARMLESWKFRVGYGKNLIEEYNREFQEHI